MTKEHALTMRIYVEWLPLQYTKGDYPYVVICGYESEREKSYILREKIADLFASINWEE
jgi:hypothetical protein